MGGIIQQKLDIFTVQRVGNQWGERIAPFQTATSVGFALIIIRVFIALTYFNKNPLQLFDTECVASSGNTVLHNYIHRQYKKVLVTSAVTQMRLE